MPMILTLAALAVLSLLLLLGYIRVARHFNITAPSRATGAIVPVGGGVIFFIGALVSLFLTPTPDIIWWILGGGTVLAVISFIDDIISLPPRMRLAAQIAVYALILWQIVPPSVNAPVYALALLACVGYTNTSNFMDGINGMLALYGLVVVGTLLVALGVPYVPEPKTPMLILRYALAGVAVAVAVFAVFNCRRRALVFAGDVGSVTLGYFIAIGLVWLALSADTISVAVFVVVFVVDTFCTFLERLGRGEEVMQSHSKHLYQRLVAAGYRPLTVSAAYAGVQLAINIVWLLLPEGARLPYTLLATIAILSTYIPLKARFK